MSGWPAGGVRLAGDDCRAEGVRVTDCGFAGIVLGFAGIVLGFAGGVIRDCHVTDNAAGIVVHKDAGIEGCTLRNNDANQILVQSDGCVLEKNIISVDTGHGSNAAVLLVGVHNLATANSITIGEPSLIGIRADGDCNELGENIVRLTAGATGAEGIRAGGTDSRVRGGKITVESTNSIAVRFTQRFGIIAILIGLLPGADGSTGLEATQVLRKTVRGRACVVSACKFESYGGNEAGKVGNREKSHFARRSSVDAKIARYFAQESALTVAGRRIAL